jgi:hypothetical protein
MKWVGHAIEHERAFERRQRSRPEQSAALRTKKKQKATEKSHYLRGAFLSTEIHFLGTDYACSVPDIFPHTAHRPHCYLQNAPHAAH